MGAVSEQPDRARAAVAKLRESRPMLHGDTELQQFRIGFEVLEWLAGAVQPGQATLETGCGYSTIVFAAAGARHSVVSPIPQEHERVRHWCREHGIECKDLEFIVRTSQDVLPRFRVDPLDLVLIDGCHAFPIPFLDWYYGASRLRKGGLCVVDDTQIRTGWTLRDFMSSETAHWTLREEWERTAVFEKTGEPVAGAEWTDQPWCAKPLRKYRRWLRQGLSGARRKLRREE